MKKALSGVITTVLLILIAIAAVTLIYSIIVPMINISLKNSKECFEARGQVSVDTESEYTCTSSASTSIMVKRGENEDVSISGFLISLKYAGTSKVYEIKGGSVEGVLMYYDGSTNLALPQPGGADTYVFDIGNVEYVDIAPIMSSGRICDASTEKIEVCSS